MAPAKAQTSFEPENLGKAINTDYSEINPVISWDGKTLFFSRVNHPDNNFGSSSSQDVWYSTLQDNGAWSKASRLPKEVNIGQYNAILSALDDGKSYLILGRYNRSGKQWVTRGFSIVQQLGPNQWSKPQRLKIKGFSRMNKGRTVSAHMTPDRELLFITFSTYPNSRRLSLYVSKRKKDNVYSRPRSVSGGAGNAMDPRTIEAPYLTADKNRIYFSADYTSGKANNNIYFADRADKDFRRWGTPMVATDTINTANWESYFKMNAKESWAYYSSTTNSFGKSDIFRVKIFEERPYLKVSGLILNQADQTLMLTHDSYNILVNGEEFTTLSINRGSASYEMTLPLGQAYTIQPTMDNWNGISADIDLTNVREYSETKLNLYFSSIPFVQVKGRIVDSETREMIPSSLNPKVLINGFPSDSIQFNQFTSSFQALLPLGEQYSFTAKVDNYTSSAEVVDVTQDVSFVEREITLLVTSHPWVELKGKVMDNSSLTPITYEASPKIVINGEVVDTVSIDPVSGDYTLRLPYGKNYVIGVQAKDYRVIDNAIDLTAYKRFASIAQNLYAERIDANMVTLSGKIINTKTGKQLEEGYEVKFRVNGVESPAFVYDATTASYTLRLPVGYNYDLTPSVLNFYNKFEPVDLSKAAPMSKISRNFYVTPIEVGQSVDIENIYFETGRAGLKPESYRSLSALIEFLNEYPNVRVEIGGHTDNVGSAQVNQRVSEERAKAVADYVIENGVSPERVVSKGYGFSKPKASNRTAEGRAQNRRVGFTIIGI
jgi:outer membrane protein OmpA-like peptidoglycan-associated protein